MIQKVTVLTPETRVLSQRSLEAYLSRTEWEKDNKSLWRNKNHQLPVIYVNPDNLGRALDSLADAEKRPTGLIWRDIMEPQSERHKAAMQ